MKHTLKLITTFAVFLMLIGVSEAAAAGKSKNKTRHRASHSATVIKGGKIAEAITQKNEIKASSEIASSKATAKPAVAAKKDKTETKKGSDKAVTSKPSTKSSNATTSVAAKTDGAKAKPFDPTKPILKAIAVHPTITPQSVTLPPPKSAVASTTPRRPGHQKSASELMLEYRTGVSITPASQTAAKPTNTRQTAQSNRGFLPSYLMRDRKSSGSFDPLEELYDKPYLLYACRTHYPIGPGAEDPDSRKYRSKWGGHLRLPTANTGGSCAVTENAGVPKLSILWDLQTFDASIYHDGGGAVDSRKAARTDYLTRIRKIKKHGRVVKTERIYIPLHKTARKLGAPVVDKAGSKLVGEQYGWFLVIPRRDTRPFHKLSPDEQKALFAKAPALAGRAYASLQDQIRNRMLAEAAPVPARAVVKR